MKNNHVIVLCILAASTACASFQEESVNTERAKVESDEVFYATLEQGGQADATKVYADANLQVLWNADDRISIYNYYTYGYEYAFQGTTGKTAGAFAKVADDAEFVTGNSLDKIYAVYPYSQDNDISNTGELNILWPSTQTYKPDSFGIGANVMVSVTTDNQLRFRNVGGYLALKLYGDNVSVTSITLRGNNGEKLSGKATITCATDEDPVLSFKASAQGSLRLNCAAPVSIGTTAEDATVFWFVVPPTQFTQGFNITVCTSDGGIFVKSTDASYDIERNTLCRMAAVEVIPYDIIPFADANFKAYCVENFDTDGDGEISLNEALMVTAIDVNPEIIASLKGIEYFKNLQSLTCSLRWDSANFSSNGYHYYRNGEEVFGLLTSLDLSSNTALTDLYCYSNQLSSLDVSNNTALTRLDCSNNQLSSLDVSNNTALTELSCSSNQLSSLDVNNNTALTTLWCDSNQLSSLDVSNNTALTRLESSNNPLSSLDVSNNTALTFLCCQSNQLSSLDVSNNTALTDLNCAYNPLSSLDVSNNTALTYLWCSSNQLSSLDVSNNTALTYLSCFNNQLSSLDVSNNTALTDLYCYSNQLSSLDVSNNTVLTYLDCHSNQLSSLDVSNNTALTYLRCQSNQLSSLDVSNNTAVYDLNCSSNQLSSLDVSNNTALIWLYCFGNPSLTEIWLKTGQTIPAFDYDTNVAQIQYKD